MLLTSFTILTILASLPALQGSLSPAAPQAEAVSFLGRQLYPLDLTDEQREPLEANLAEARKNFEAHPDDAEALIWLGRRTAYLGRYGESIGIFTQGAERFPHDPRFLRHRGHRYISIRKLDEAIADLSRAAELMRDQPDEIEPDGIPNARNQPTSTTHSNVWYHLGLAQYLRGDYRPAVASYRNCLSVSRNDDMRVASKYWLYMALRRQGEESEAEKLLPDVHAELDIIENHTYLNLLLLFKGEREPGEVFGEGPDALASATAGYGVGNWHRFNGREEAAFEVFERVVQGEQWAAFGFLAAEAELARRKGLMGPK